VKLNHVAFTSGGPEANEMAFMIARLSWSKAQPTKTKIISAIGGYHGNTSQTMSVTGKAMGGQTDIQNIVAGHVRIPAPYMYRSDEPDEETYVEVCAQDLVAMIERAGPETVAAIIAEPMIGVGQ
jgi:adenosylmethionine-8-amino-7-oxononanoate aminotransferase